VRVIIQPLWTFAFICVLYVWTVRERERGRERGKEGKREGECARERQCV